MVSQQQVSAGRTVSAWLFSGWAVKWEHTVGKPCQNVGLPHFGTAFSRADEEYVILSVKPDKYRTRIGGNGL